MVLDHRDAVPYAYRFDFTRYPREFHLESGLSGCDGVFERTIVVFRRAVGGTAGKRRRD